jgi:hypothetical protein
MLATVTPAPPSLSFGSSNEGACGLDFNALRRLRAFDVLCRGQSVRTTSGGINRSGNVPVLQARLLQVYAQIQLDAGDFVLLGRVSSSVSVC